MTASTCCWELFSVASLASRWGSRWEAWLHPLEAARARELGDDSRRQSWILGRIAARQLLMKRLCANSVCPRQIQIISQCPRRKGCPPLVLIEGAAQTWSLSLSHSRDWIAVALAPGRRRVGIDVVDLDAIDPHRLNAFFGTEPWHGGKSRLAAAVRWAVVESAYKSLGQEQPFRPRQFQLRLEGSSAIFWRYRDAGGMWSGDAQWWPRERAVVALARQTLGWEPSNTREELAA